MLTYRGSAWKRCVLTRPIAAASRTNPVRLQVREHGLKDGDAVHISGVAGMTQLNEKRTLFVASTTANAFSLAGVDGTRFSLYLSGGIVARAFAIESLVANRIAVSVGADGCGFADGAKVTVLGVAGLTSPAQVHTVLGWTRP